MEYGNHMETMPKLAKLHGEEEILYLDVNSHSASKRPKLYQIKLLNLERHMAIPQKSPTCVENSRQVLSSSP